MKVYGIILSLVILSLSVFQAGCSGCDNPCTEGTDVRVLPDTVPEELAWYLYYEYEDERIIGEIMNTHTGGLPVANPKYPSGKVVVIRVATSDFPPNTAADHSYTEEIFFSEEPGVRSVKGYFQENSYNTFHVENGSIPPWLEFLWSLEFFQPIEANPMFDQMALIAADVDWSELDTNGDDIISRAEAQIVFLIPNATANPPSGFASKRNMAIGSIYTPYGNYDFGTRPIVHFSLKAASETDYAVNPIRSHPTVVHELCHAFFELPDRYGSPDYVTGTGNYDIMCRDQRWLNMTPYDKMKIGWFHPPIVDAHMGDCLNFIASEEEPAALLIYPPEEYQSDAEHVEYWIVENRNKAYSAGNYDSSLPDSGLAVWYVQEDTWAGDDNVRLIDAELPGQAGILYENPGSNALFKFDPDDQIFSLIDSQGIWILNYFRGVADPDRNVYAEF